MKKRMISMCAAMLMLAACNEDAINKDAKNTSLTSVDLVTMTDQMAASITADPTVAQIAKPMIIVVKPVQNLTNEIIRPQEKELYVHRVQALLATKPQLRGQYVFVLNRDDYMALQQQEGMTPEELGTPEERVKPEYSLTATFYASTSVSAKQRGDTYLCDFELQKIDKEGTGVIVWEDKYETSKHIKKSLLD